MDIQTTTNELYIRAKRLEELAAAVEKLANDKNFFEAIYEKDLAIAILKLRAGKITAFEDIPVQNLTGNEIPKVAAGIVWESFLQAANAKSKLDAHLQKLKALEDSISALQSINRYLDVQKIT